MSTDPELMGQWIADNPHETDATARCPTSDGRVIAKLCNVGGTSWVWFSGGRLPIASLRAEIEELRDLPSMLDATPVDEILDGIPEGGGFKASPKAYPADRSMIELAVCNGCRRMYRVTYDGNDALAVSLHPLGERHALD